MVKKKRTIIKENRIQMLVKEEKEREEWQKNKLVLREEMRRERKEELIEKLQKVANKINAEAGAATGSAGAGGKEGEGDVEMGQSVNMRKHGVIRRIKKHKKGPKAGRVSASKALLRAAKAQGVIPSVQHARRILDGKKKNEFKPDGQERKRDKILRRAREKRERRGPKKQEDQEEEEEEEED
mmetsp:Transcript_93293/g.273104  ORF Transcript_93293/g.273104 Transcript_93293/m.273104 type:complete len:183 (-) Transcript_93293:13-561(-)